MLHEEQLAIKTDKVPWYLTRDQKALRPSELLPRDGELSKSAWAFSCDEGTDPGDPSLELQALGMLLHAARKQLRSTITGVRFSRGELEDGWTAEENGAHPIKGLEPTHRSLATGDLGIAQRMLAECSFREWSYSRDMLIGALRTLKERDLIADEYKPQVELVLACASS